MQGDTAAPRGPQWGGRGERQILDMPTPADGAPSSAWAQLPPQPGVVPLPSREPPAMPHGPLTGAGIGPRKASAWAGQELTSLFLLSQLGSQATLPMRRCWSTVGSSRPAWLQLQVAGFLPSR